LSKGGITGTLVDIRLVFKMALEMEQLDWYYVITIHQVRWVPSDAKQITKKLRTAGDSLEIKFWII
jgi:DNA repair protein RadC